MQGGGVVGASSSLLPMRLEALLLGALSVELSLRAIAGSPGIIQEIFTLFVKKIMAEAGLKEIVAGSR